MYSVVLLAALTPGSDVTPPPVAVAPVAVGCCGGTVVYGCSGSCNGCWGLSCYGSCHGRGGLFGKHHRPSCHGCSGSNCFGSCHGCSGYMPPYMPAGCWGSSCHGWGCGVYPSYTVPMTPPAVVVPMAPATGTTTPPKVDDKDTKKGGGMEASLKFRLPAAAKLYVDGRPTTGEGTERSFFTPALARGQKYFYEVKAELVVDGKTVVEEKRVIVEAGAELVETFPVLTTAAAKASSVASK